MVRLVIGLSAIALVAGCHPAGSRVGSVPPARGNVVRDESAARADTERAYGHIQAGKYSDAEPFLRRAIEEDPNYGPAHNDLGIIHYHAERLYDAAWEFQNAIKLMPRQPQPHNNLGLVMEAALRLKDAEQAYREAHELDPSNPEYAGNLAKLRLRLGEHDEQTRKLLEIVVLSDTRPDWLDWAKFNLARLQTLPQQTPTSQPAPGS
jgi:Flp pilus assembly protein TadD